MSLQKVILISAVLIITFLAWILRYQITSVENGITHRLDRWTGEVTMLINGRVYDPYAISDMVDFQIRDLIHRKELPCRYSKKLDEFKQKNSSYSHFTDNEHLAELISKEAKIPFDELAIKVCQGEVLYSSTKFKELREGNPSYKSYNDEAFLNAIADKVKMTVDDLKKKIGYEQSQK